MQLAVLRPTGFGASKTSFTTISTITTRSGTRTARNRRRSLLDAINSDQHFLKWIQRIKALPDFLVEDALAQAEPLGLTAAEAQAGRDFLPYRRDNLEKILRQHRNEFTRIKQWSLI
jgi:hypothetical protein